VIDEVVCGTGGSGDRSHQSRSNVQAIGRAAHFALAVLLDLFARASGEREDVTASGLSAVTKKKVPPGHVD